MKILAAAGNGTPEQVERALRQKSVHRFAVAESVPSGPQQRTASLSATAHSPALLHRVYHWLTDDHDDEFEVSDAREWLEKHRPRAAGIDRISRRTTREC